MGFALIFIGGIVGFGIVLFVMETIEEWCSRRWPIRGDGDSDD